jgi:hypothetical protein
MAENDSIWSAYRFAWKRVANWIALSLETIFVWVLEWNIGRGRGDLFLFVAPTVASLYLVSALKFRRLMIVVRVSVWVVVVWSLVMTIRQFTGEPAIGRQVWLPDEDTGILLYPAAYLAMIAGVFWSGLSLCRVVQLVLKHEIVESLAYVPSILPMLALFLQAEGHLPDFITLSIGGGLFWGVVRTRFAKDENYIINN